MSSGGVGETRTEKLVNFVGAPKTTNERNKSKSTSFWKVRKKLKSLKIQAVGIHERESLRHWKFPLKITEIPWRTSGRQLSLGKMKD